MWARQLELTLAVWLLVSPFVFGHAGDTAWWATDLLCGYGVAIVSLLPRWSPLRRAHLLNLPIGCWLIVFGWLRAPAPAALNELAVGLCVATLSLVPARERLGRGHARLGSVG
jgi:hypothetical protein